MLKGLLSEGRDTQVIFRNLLTALAYPGTLSDIDVPISCPEAIQPASGGILLTLLDFETPLWSDLSNDGEAIQWLRFHTGAPLTRQKHHCLFAFCTECDQLEDPALFNTGTIKAPDISTTLIVQTNGISDTGPIRLTGPGIEKSRQLGLEGIHKAFLKNRSVLCSTYPLGVDMLFVCDRTFTALPRTTKAEID